MTRRDRKYKTSAERQAAYRARKAKKAERKAELQNGQCVTPTKEAK